MNIRSDNATVNPTPTPAQANTRRDALPKQRIAAVSLSAGPRFDRVVQSAWRRATGRGFSPGQECEYLLEDEFRQASGHS